MKNLCFLALNKCCPGRRVALSWLTFWLTFLLAKYSTFVLQISHMVSSESLLSCDAMFFSVGSKFFGVKMHFLEIGFFLYLFFHKFLCIFHNSKTIQGIWMNFYRDVDPDDQAGFTQVV